MRADVPETPAKMVDRLQEMFGIGSYDDLVGTHPWHKERMLQIGKLKALLKSRRATLVEVWTAAQYARRHHKQVHELWQVFALIPEAMRERFRLATEARRSGAAGDIHDAILEALEAGEHGWADRLTRAQDHPAAIREWRASRG